MELLGQAAVEAEHSQVLKGLDGFLEDGTMGAVEQSSQGCGIPK